MAKSTIIIMPDDDKEDESNVTRNIIKYFIPKV